MGRKYFTHQNLMGIIPKLIYIRKESLLLERPENKNLIKYGIIYTGTKFLPIEKINEDDNIKTISGSNTR